MVSLGHFRDQFFDDNVEHGTGGETEQVGQGGDKIVRGENGEHGTNRFDDAGEDTAGKSPAFFMPSARRGIEMIAPSGKF